MITQVRDRTNDADSRELLGEAVRVLTHAARVTSDFAEFVMHALAGAAANVGGIEPLLAGRPGSWEAHGVRELLIATVGHDETYLHAYRTEPVVVRVCVEDLLTELGHSALYEQAHEELDRREDALPTRHNRDGENDTLVEELAALDELDLLHDALDAQRRDEWTAYGAVFAANVQHAVAELVPTLPVQVQVIVEDEQCTDLGSGTDSLALRLWARARDLTPPPDTGSPLGRLESGPPS